MAKEIIFDAEPKDADVIIIEGLAHDQLKQVNTWIKSLSPDQRKGLLRVSAVRHAEINDVHNQLYKNFPALVTPDNFNGALYESRFALMDSLQRGEAALITMLTAYQFAKDALMNNQMKATVDILGKARFNASKDAHLAKAVTEITATYHPGNQTALNGVDQDLAAGANIVLDQVATDKMFTNTGVTILEVSKEGGTANDVRKLNPSTGLKVPKGWTKIRVINKSATDQGAFNLFFKPQK